ncbi:MAG: hypothetical protein AAF411_07030 [Myxococcota bacterium]
MRATVPLLLALAACAGEYEVSIAFDPPELVDEAVSIEVAVVESCDVVSPDGAFRTVRSRSTLGASGGAAPLGDLPPGTYALAARATDAACGTLAFGCRAIEVSSGGSGTLSVTLVAAVGQACEAAECTAGRCDDADAGIDMATEAMATPDADMRTPADADMTLDSDAGDADPIDADMGMAEVCTPESEGASCFDEVDQPGRCRQGACCAGCWNGSACVEGDRDEACGREGGVCETCECPMDRCSPEGCIGASRWERVAAGDDFVCATGARDGRRPALYCWGANDAGQTGQADLDVVDVPALVEGPNGARSIALSNRTAFVVDQSGRLWSWGANVRTDGRCEELGLLGRFTGQCANSEPERLGTGSNYCEVTVARGEEEESDDVVPAHACAIREGGRLQCWGANDRGQIGNGRRDVNAGFAFSVPGGAWLRAGLALQTTCAIRAFEGEAPSGCPDPDDVGLAYCWGSHERGELADFDPVRSSPPPVDDDVGEGTFFASVSGSGNTLCARWAPAGELGNSISCWGDARFGQRAIIPELVALELNLVEIGPVDVRTTNPLVAGPRTFYTRSTIGPLGWGIAPPSLPLEGADNCGPRSEPCATEAAAIDLALDSEPVQLAVGGSVVCAIDSDAQLVCFGSNEQGQLGSPGAEERAFVCVP